MNKKMINKCKCGKDITDESTLIDSLYPCNREKTEWNIVCQLHNGGWGRVVYASSKNEVIERWNSGVTDEVDEVDEEALKRVEDLIREAEKDASN